MAGITSSHEITDTDSLRDLASRSINLSECVMLKASQLVRELTQGEYCVLVYLESCTEDATAVEIADEVSLTRPRITQIVSSLERRGFVTRTKDDHDKRKVNIRITEAGRGMVNTQRENALERHMNYLTYLGDDRDAFLRILEKSIVYFAERDSK